MSFRVDIKGLTELKKILGSQLDDIATESIKVGVFAGTHAVQADARKYIANNENSLTAEQTEAASKSGAVKIGENQLQVQTGRLQNSIMTGIETDGSGVVYTDVEYARIHELGGYTGRGHNILMPARPYLMPALTKNIDYTLKFIKTEFIAKVGLLGGAK